MREQARWHERLAALLAEHQVPGAALGILRVGANGPDETVVVADGLLSRAGRATVRPDSSFHIGSITKVWTASLVLRLVDEGKVELDTPVHRYLPELALSDPEATNTVTLRQLLSHTSGIDGDHLVDTGRGEDAIEKYVASLARVPVSYPAGSLFSYSNAGYVLAGRVVEAMSGMSWDEALRTTLCRPLGLTDTVPDPAIAPRAVGHRARPDGAPVAPAAIPRSIGPAGIITSTVRDLLRFAGMHLAGGLALDGTRVLSEHSVRAMRSVQVRLPDDRHFPSAWGLGWALWQVGTTEIAGHDGNIRDQSAFLRVVPNAGLAVAILTNVADAPEFAHALVRAVLADELGIVLPPRPAPVTGARHDSLSPDWLGRYKRTGCILTVFSTPAGLVLREQRSQADPQEYPVVPTGQDSFLAWNDVVGTWLPGSFVVAAGRRFLHFSLRTSAESIR